MKQPLVIELPKYLDARGNLSVIEELVSAINSKKNFLEKTGINRNPNIELLRFVLMVAICVWHTFVHGYDYKNPHYQLFQ